MSLFGSSPPADEPAPFKPAATKTAASTPGTHSASLFHDDDRPAPRSSSAALFADDDDGSGHSSPWDMPTPRKHQTRADLIRNLLSPADVPELYIDVFDRVVEHDGRAGRVTSGGIARTLAAGKLGADEQARIMGLVAPSGGGEPSLGRPEFNVLLALIGLAQEGEAISLDGVDERRRSKSHPLHASIITSFLSFSLLPRHHRHRPHLLSLPSSIVPCLAAPSAAAAAAVATDRPAIHPSIHPYICIGGPHWDPSGWSACLPRANLLGVRPPTLL